MNGNLILITSFRYQTLKLFQIRVNFVAKSRKMANGLALEMLECRYLMMTKYICGRLRDSWQLPTMKTAGSSAINTQDSAEKASVRLEASALLHGLRVSATSKTPIELICLQ